MPSTARQTRATTDRRQRDGFRRLILRWRRAQKLSQIAAARALGVPVRTLQDWEYGKRAPRGLALRLITEQIQQISGN